MHGSRLTLGLALALAVTLVSPLAEGAGSPDIPLPVLVLNGQVQYDGTGHAIPNWNGTNVDLLAADAWAQCAPILGQGTTAQQAAASTLATQSPPDAYLSYLLTEMQWAPSPCPIDPLPSAPLTVTCSGTCTGVQLWAQQRETPQCNVDSSTGEPTVVAFYPNNTGQLQNYAVPLATTFVDLTGDIQGAANQAQYEIDIAELNLCMGQRLTEYSSSADSLLLSAQDQLQLVEITRERAQIAMLHFAKLGRALANTPPSTDSDITANRQIFPLFRSWASRASGDAALPQLGQDFAVAVQLHIQTTQSEAQLLARSASARLPRGGNPLSTPETDWGSGSWRQRLNSLFYGSNPLGNGQSGSGDVDLTQPGALQRFLALEQSGGEGFVPWDATWTVDNQTDLFFWPNQFPPFTPAEYYATTDVTDPRVQVLLGLARQADALLLQELNADASIPLSQGSTTLPFRRVNVPTSAGQMYLDVEAYLQTQECIKAGNPSCMISPDAFAGSSIDYQSMLLFQRYGVTPDHATTLVSSLADAVSRYQLPDFPPQMALAYLLGAGTDPSQMTEVEGAMHVVGAHNTLDPASIAARIPQAQGTWYYLDKNSVIASPSMAERAPLYSMGAPNWIPMVYFERATSAQSGFAQLDQDKDMGALSALTATRELLDFAMQQAQSTLPGVSSTYLAQASAVVSAIDAAEGTDSVSVFPTLVTGVQTVGTQSLIEQAGGVNGVFVNWQVVVRHSTTDPFFAGVADGDLTALAVRPEGLEATAALSSGFVSIGGNNQSYYFSTNLVGSSAQVGASQSLSDGTLLRFFTVPLPSISSLDPSIDPGSNTVEASDNLNGAPQTFVSLFLQRIVNGQPQYYLLARHVGLTVNGSIISNTPVYVPADGQYFAFGGTLGDMATSAWTTQPANWSKPGIDGFGYPTDWVPPSDPSLYGSSAPDAVSYYLNTAQSAGTAASSAINDAVTALLQEDSDSASLASAQEKAAGLDQIQASSLCGAATCDTTNTAIDLNATGFLQQLTCPSGSPQLCTDVANALVQIPPNVLLSTAVYNARNDASTPSFSAYQGGTLQEKLITEWTALKGIQSAVTAAIAGYNAQEAAVEAANADVTFAQDTRAADCTHRRSKQLTTRAGASPCHPVTAPIRSRPR